MDRTQRVLPPGDATQVISGSEPTTVAQPSVSMEIIPGSTHALATRRTTEHILVQIKAPGSIGARRPLNLALAVDRSGSMEGEPLAYVKQACSHIVDLLTPSDVLSIVTFEDQVDVVMPARRVVNRDLIKQLIARIQAGRTTNLYDGILTACNQVASVPPGQYLNRVLVFTDGEPTAGIKDFAAITGLASEQKAKGIAITTLGFGPEYNEELLVGIARRGGGTFYHISRPELIPEVFRKELSSLLTTAASDLRLHIQFPRWVSIRHVYGLQAQYGTRSAEIQLPDLEAGAALAVLAELEFEPRPTGPYRIAVATLRYTDTASAGKEQTATAHVEVEFVADESLVSQGRNPLVAAQLEVARASAALERTVMGMKTQQISPATALLELEKTRALLTAQGRTQEAQQVTEAIERIKQGSRSDAEKTLIGTLFTLEKGKQ